MHSFWVAWSELLAVTTKCSYWDLSSPQCTPILSRSSQPKTTSNVPSADIPVEATAQGEQGTQQEFSGKQQQVADKGKGKWSLDSPSLVILKSCVDTILSKML